MERNSENRNRYDSDRNRRQNDQYNDRNQSSDYSQRNQSWERDEDWRTPRQANEGRYQFGGYSGRNNDQDNGYDRQYDHNRSERRLESMGSLGNDFGRADYADNTRNDQRNRSAYGNDDYRRNWWNKTKDEVSGWFGDENAQQRRDRDQAGEHRGKGPKGYVRTDERIKEDIHEKLTDDASIDASEIEVDVRSGEVFLKGTVRTRQEKRRAEDIIENVSGVKDVENHIKLQQENAQSGNAGQNTGQYGDNKFGIHSGSGARTSNTGEYSTHN